MKPIAIFRHLAHEGPGYFAQVLAAQQIPSVLIAIDAGDAVPTCANAYSGLVFMGGNMSVNDDLPWIAQELALIRDAVAQDIPVLGHCLGGQLLAKALGGTVAANPVKEIGWGEVCAADNLAARHWLGELTAFQAFHWHGETFSLPVGATLLLSSAHCAHQAYSIDKHLGLQCHIEMTESMIQTWCEVGEAELAAAKNSPAVQSAKVMQAQASTYIPPLHHVADQLYAHWLQGIQAFKCK